MSTTAFRCWSWLSLALVHESSYAASTHEQTQLSLMLQQLDTIELLSARAEAISTSDSGERYRFDYPRLCQDIQRIREGLQGFLSPSRAQPRDTSELVGDYHLDTPSAEPSP